MGRDNGKLSWMQCIFVDVLKNCGNYMYENEVLLSWNWMVLYGSFSFYCWKIGNTEKQIVFPLISVI